MADEVGMKITQNQYETLSRDFVLDLQAVFKVLEAEIKELTGKAIEEEWTPDRLIKEIEGLL